MSLFVGNIPASVSARDLETLFGKVGKCRIDLKPGQKQSQFAFVIFDAEKDASSAVASLNQFQLAGNSLRVRFTSNHSTYVPEPSSRSRSPNRVEKQIINLAPSQPTVQKGVVTLQSIKAVTGGSTIISLAGTSPKKPGEEAKVVTLTPTAPVVAVEEQTSAATAQQTVVTASPPKAVPVPAKPEQPKPPVAAKPEPQKVEVKPEPLPKLPTEKKPEETKAPLPASASKPQTAAPTSIPSATPVTPTPPATTLKPAQPAAPQTAQVPVNIPAVKPVPQKQEEDKKPQEEDTPDPEGIVSIADRPDDVKCVPCGKVFKKAARKAHVTSKAHQKSREAAKK